MQPEKQASSKGSTIGLALLFGIGAVSLSSSFYAFVIGALIGALFAQVFHLRSRTHSLEEQLRAIRQSLKASATVDKPIESAVPQPGPTAVEPMAQAPKPQPSVAQTDEALAREQAAAEQARREEAARAAAAERFRTNTTPLPRPDAGHAG